MNLGQVNPQLLTRPTPKRSRWIKISVTAIILFIIAVPALAGYVGWQLTHPHKKPLASNPSQLHLAYEDVQFPSPYDQTILRGWYIKPEVPTDKIVIFAHGYRNNRVGEDSVLPTAKALRDQGIATLLFDFRNSGESDGSLTSVGEFESKDLIGAVNYVKKLAYKKIGLMGFSMGASTSIMVAPQVPEETEIPLLTGIDPDTVRPIDSIKEMGNRHVLLIHSKGDPSIPYSNSQQLENTANNPNVQFWLAPGTEHVGTYNVVPEEYVNKATSFFKEYLK